MSNVLDKNKYLYFTKILFVLIIMSSIKIFAHSESNSLDENISHIYVFFDQDHSYVHTNNKFVSTNFITIDPSFSKNISANIFGSEHFCKNIFYFSNNKIIFYNPSQYMSSYVWCQVELTHKITQKTASYRFILNKTFSAWCQEKETNISIGKTIQAVLNIFETKVCNDNFNSVLADTRVLNLSNSKIDDISPIAGFLQVRSLWLDNNDIENVEALGSMRNLVFLSLNNNFIANAKSIGDMPSLRWVFLNNNQIINIDFINKLRTLKFLGITGNLINDPTPLYSVSSSTYVLASGNPFIKNLCGKNSKNNMHGLKNCFEYDNTSLKLNHNIKLIDPDSKETKKLHKQDEAVIEKKEVSPT